MRSILIILSLLTASVGSAANVTWTVDLLFENGAVGSGTFDYDADTNAYSNVDMFVDDPDPEAGSFADGYGDAYIEQTYDYLYIGESNSGFGLFLPFQDHPFYTIYLQLVYDSPLTNNGGVISVDPLLSGYFEDATYENGGITPVLFITGGTVTANVVPLPAAIWLFGSGLGLLGWASKIRRR